MTTEADRQLRRYLLGLLGTEECEAVERGYFERADSLDRVAAAEEELIDEYLAGTLAAGEREPFERHYLAAPGHRTRVAVTRELRHAKKADTRPALAARVDAPGAIASRTWSPPALLALAASILILVAAGTWLARSRSGGAPDVVEQRVQQPAVSPAPPPEGPGSSSSAAGRGRPATPIASAPVTFAVSLSPIHVRGTEAPDNVTIPAGTDVVALRLLANAGERAPRSALIVVRTVSGTEVWRGAPAGQPDPQPRVLAQALVPADRLRPEDYIVELFGTEGHPGGKPIDAYQYFLRVRER